MNTAGKKYGAYAWAKYFEVVQGEHRGTIDQYKDRERWLDVGGTSEIPKFLLDEWKEDMKTLKKKVECPICFDIIEPDNLKIAFCGHKYCEKCFKQLDKCAMCRKKFKH